MKASPCSHTLLYVAAAACMFGAVVQLRSLPRGSSAAAHRAVAGAALTGRPGQGGNPGAPPPPMGPFEDIDHAAARASTHATLSLEQEEAQLRRRLAEIQKLRLLPGAAAPAPVPRTAAAQARGSTDGQPPELALAQNADCGAVQPDLVVAVLASPKERSAAARQVIRETYARTHTHTHTHARTQALDGTYRVAWNGTRWHAPRPRRPR